MDKHIIAIYGLGTIQNPRTIAEKILGSYLGGLSAKAKYQDPGHIKNISVAQFIKIIMPELKIWHNQISQ